MNLHIVLPQKFDLKYDENGRMPPFQRVMVITIVDDIAFSAPNISYYPLLIKASTGFKNLLLKVNWA